MQRETADLDIVHFMRRGFDENVEEDSEDGSGSDLLVTNERGLVNFENEIKDFVNNNSGQQNREEAEVITGDELRPNLGIGSIGNDGRTQDFKQCNSFQDDLLACQIIEKRIGIDTKNLSLGDQMEAVRDSEDESEQIGKLSNDSIARKPLDEDMFGTKQIILDDTVLLKRRNKKNDVLSNGSEGWLGEVEKIFEIGDVEGSFLRSPVRKEKVMTERKRPKLLKSYNCKIERNKTNKRIFKFAEGFTELDNYRSEDTTSILQNDKMMKGQILRKSPPSKSNLFAKRCSSKSSLIEECYKPRENSEEKTRFIDFPNTTKQRTRRSQYLNMDLELTSKKRKMEEKESGEMKKDFSRIKEIEIDEESEISSSSELPGRRYYSGKYFENSFHSLGFRLFIKIR